MRRSISYFWPFSRAQFYGEPGRLTEAGLLTDERETGGRRRRNFSITEAGRGVMRTWLAQPVNEPFEIRDLAQMKLFFAELGDEADVRALARSQQAYFEGRLAELQAIAAHFADDPVRRRRLAPLNLGLRVYQSAIDFWGKIAENAP